MGFSKNPFLDPWAYRVNSSGRYFCSSGGSVGGGGREGTDTSDVVDRWAVIAWHWVDTSRDGTVPRVSQSTQRHPAVSWASARCTAFVSINQWSEISDRRGVTIHALVLFFRPHARRHLASSPLPLLRCLPPSLCVWFSDWTRYCYLLAAVWLSRPMWLSADVVSCVILQTPSASCVRRLIADQLPGTSVTSRPALNCLITTLCRTIVSRSCEQRSGTYYTIPYRCLRKRMQQSKKT